MNEDNKVSLCWGVPKDDKNLKPIAFAKSSNLTLSPDDSPSPLKVDNGFNMSFEMGLSKKDGNRLLRLLGQKKERLPRKEKKRILNFIRYHFPILYNELSQVYSGRQIALSVKNYEQDENNKDNTSTTN